MPSARQQGDARDSRRCLRNLDSPVKMLGAAHPIGAGGRQHDRRHHRMGKDRALAMFARLDDPHRRGRTAAGAAAAAGRRAQRRHHRVGLGRARRRTCTTRSRPTSAIRRSTPTGCCTARRRLSTDIVPVLDPVRHTATHVKMPVRDPKTPAPGKPLAAVAVLGRRSHLGQPGQHAQPDVRREGARVVHVA